MKAPVNKIIPFSSVDGPGNRTAVFLQGCNFDCVYCHNPETIHPCNGCGACLAHCPTGALCAEAGRVAYDYTKCVFCDACFQHCPHSSSPRVRLLEAAQVMELVKKNMPFVRGLTVSGGECTLHRDFLVELLGLAKMAGLNTLLDSNGNYDFAADPELLALTDGVMLDVKAWNEAEHKAVTGQSNALVRKNLVYLARAAKLEEVRTVVVPGLFNAEETIRQVSDLLAPYMAARSIRYKIIAYRPMGVREEHRHFTSPTPKYLQELSQIAQENGLHDIVII